jgi:hypothetical protein
MYPAAFTEKEKKILAELSGQTFKIPLNAAWYEWKTEKKREMKGQLCRMGQMYAKIFPNGDVTRCCAPGSGALGNIFAKDFRLLEEPQPCEFELKCPCFKAMFVGQEKKWLPLWEVAEHKVFTRNKMMHSGGRRYQKASRSSRSLQKKENT